LGNSLQEQLLKAGLTDEKKLQKAKKAKQRKEKEQRHARQKQEDEVTRLTKQAHTQKAARDRELNRKKNEEANRKAVQAQIRQLIELNRQEKGEGDLAYNFSDKKRVTRVYVTSQQHAQLSSGRLAIAKLYDRYELIPGAVAEKIAMRDKSCIIVYNEGADGGESDDPYADFKVPDDLMW
jgi:uncharacterized protein YaiL (DUF2058 family)